jgi:hypothetical protein
VPQTVDGVRRDLAHARHRLSRPSAACNQRVVRAANIQCRTRKGKIMRCTFTRSTGVAVLRALLPLFCALLLVACSGAAGPSGDAIGKALSMKLPDGVKVDDVSIKVSENRGTKVEPEYQSRADVKLEFTENYYDITGHLGGKSVVKKTFAKGQTISGTVITSATPQGDDSWNIDFERVDIPHIAGMAESQYQPDSYVEADSDAYKQLQDKLAADKQKAQQEVAQKIADLRKRIVGTWAAKFPMLHDNSVWASNDNRKLGIQIRFDDSDGAVGQGEGVLYDFDTPAHEAKVPIGYVVDPSGQFVLLSFTSEVQAPGVSFRTGPGSHWKFTPDGKLVNGDNNEWTVQMERDGPVLKQRLANVKKYDDYLNAEHQLAAQYHAANADGRFRDLPLRNNTYGNFFVVGQAKAGEVDGDVGYSEYSVVAAAAVHAGALKNNQAGIVKITRQFGFGYQQGGSTRNGVTSQSFRNNTYYTISLVKALPVYQP